MANISSSQVAVDQFKETFGELQPDGSYELSAVWQTGLNNGTQCGQIIGLIINGWVSERFGYRYTVIACLTAITAWIGILYSATSPEQLLAAYILCGIVCQVHPHYPQSRSPPSFNISQIALGCLSNALHYLRFRSLPSCASRLSNHVG
jgi:MFS family permease